MAKRSRRLRSLLVRIAYPGAGARWFSVQPERRTTMESMHVIPHREPWNKGKLVGQKAPLKLKDIWAIRVRLQFEITLSAREALQSWIKRAGLKSENFLFPNRVGKSPHLGTRQYARIVDHWVEDIGLDSAAYGTHSIRRTKASLIYRRTKNLRAVQLCSAIRNARAPCAIWGS